MLTRAERTRQRIADRALELFERQGFEATTIAQIADAADVTPMTVFRHFATKEQLVLEDPYDPVIAQAVGEQPRDLPPLDRAIRAVRAAWAQLPEPEGDVVRRRVRIAAASPAVRAGAWRGNARTEALIAEQLVADGADHLEAAVAASAVLAALTTAIFAWAQQDAMPLGTAVTGALDVLRPAAGPEDPGGG